MMLKIGEDFKIQNYSHALMIIGKGFVDKKDRDLVFQSPGVMELGA
jgi:hypothetical protein